MGVQMYRLFFFYSNPKPANFVVYLKKLSNQILV